MEDTSPHVPKAFHKLIMKVLLVKGAQGPIVVVELVIYFTF